MSAPVKNGVDGRWTVKRKDRVERGSESVTSVLLRTSYHDTHNAIRIQYFALKTLLTECIEHSMHMRSDCIEVHSALNAFMFKSVQH